MASENGIQRLTSAIAQYAMSHAAQVRRLLAALRPIGRAATRDVQPAVSAVALTDAVFSSPEGRAAFLEADGAAALLELLDTRQPEVATRPAGSAVLFLTMAWSAVSMDFTARLKRAMAEGSL